MCWNPSKAELIKQKKESVNSKMGHWNYLVRVQKTSKKMKKKVVSYRMQTQNICVVESKWNVCYKTSRKQKSPKDHHKQLNTNKMNKQGEIDIFLLTFTYNLLTHKVIENLGWTIMDRDWMQ